MLAAVALLALIAPALARSAPLKNRKGAEPRYLSEGDTDVGLAL